MRHSRLKTYGFVISLSLVVSAGAIREATGAKNGTFGEATVLATVPTPPGFPEGIAVHGNLVYVAGPATFGTGGDGQPSRVISFNLKTGALVETFAAQGENLNLDHANSCIAFDGHGRLYVRS